MPQHLHCFGQHLHIVFCQGNVRNGITRIGIAVIVLPIEVPVINPQQGQLGTVRKLCDTLQAAAQILYEADRKTYGGSWEFLVYTEPGDPPIEYRVRVDNREYQRSILRLTDLLSMASRVGHAVRLRF